MTSARLTAAIALFAASLSACRTGSAGAAPTSAPPAPPASPADTTRPNVSTDVLDARRLILGIDGNGIDIRPLLAAPNVSVIVEYAARENAGSSSPWETNVYRLTNRSARPLVVRIPTETQTITRQIDPGASNDIVYEIRDFNRALWLENGDNDKRVLESSAKYDPGRHAVAPYSKRRQEGAPIPLVINVFGYETVLTLEFK